VEITEQGTQLVSKIECKVEREERASRGKLLIWRESAVRKGAAVARRTPEIRTSMVRQFAGRTVTGRAELD
jgi:hypothetical protein